MLLDSHLRQVAKLSRQLTQIVVGLKGCLKYSTTHHMAQLQLPATAVGTAQATDIDISFTAIDTYAFRISDGERTAVVDPTSVSAVGTTACVAEIKAAIEYGLAAAGMTSSISVADNGDGSLTFVQSAGRKFLLLRLNPMRLAQCRLLRLCNTTGTAKKFLDDGNASSASGVSEVNLGSSSLASDALAIIDSALNDVSSERAKLGAVMNRLDHTIASLTYRLSIQKRPRAEFLMLILQVKLPI